MSNSASRSLAFPFLAHCCLAAAASVVLAASANGSLSYLSTTSLDPLATQRSVQISLLPAGAAVAVGSHDTLTARMDTQGQVPEKVSLLLSLPGSSLALGAVSSPDASCNRTLEVLRQEGEVMLQCSLEKPVHPVQLVDLFTLSYVPTTAGSAVIGIQDDQSQVSGPAGTLRVDGRQASLTITP
jgi:hypothetical protein